MTARHDDDADLDVARQLIDAGIPVFAAAPATDDAGNWDPTGGTGGCGYWLPKQWEKTTPTRNWLDPTVPGFEQKAWRPGWALCAVMGHGLDLLDVDPRNGGDATRAGLQAAGLWPMTYGAADTPSGGTHEFVASLNVGSRDGVQPGLDVKGGLPDGTSRGFAFIAPTHKLSKTTGEIAAYRWTSPPDLAALTDGDDDTGKGVADLVREARQHKAAGAHASDVGDFLAGKEWPHDQPIEDGERHRALVSYAGSLRRRDVRLDEAEILMERRWQACPQPPAAKSPLPLSEAVDKLRDVYARYRPGDGPETPQDVDQALAVVAAPTPATWAPVDLSDVLDGTYVEAAPTLLVRDDGQALLYAGLTHSLHGESESGKSLLMQIEAVRQINAGQDVLYIDFESDRHAVTQRLLTFGADRDAIRERFTYLRPEVQPSSSPAEQAGWEAMLARSYALAVIDGVTDCLGVFGYSTKDNDDIVAWHRAVPRTIADRTGAAVVLIDHVTKDSETRGRFALGGQAKMNALTGAAYTVDIKEPLGKNLRGVIVLRVAKDRPGTIRAHCGPMRADRTQEASRVVVDSRGDVPVVTVESPAAGSGSNVAPGAFRPTALMEMVTDTLLLEPGLTKNKIVERLGRNRKATMQAVDILVAEGNVVVKPGAGSSQHHSVTRPYRQVDDPLSDRFEAAGTTEPSERVVPGSSPYTGELGTTLNRFPGTTSEPVEPHGTSSSDAPEDCSSCGARLLLRQPGRTVCEKCRLAAAS